jgi:hypothetical protein
VIEGGKTLSEAGFERDPVFPSTTMRFFPERGGNSNAGGFI